MFGFAMFPETQQHDMRTNSNLSKCKPVFHAARKEGNQGGFEGFDWDEGVETGCCTSTCECDKKHAYKS